MDVAFTDLTRQHGRNQDVGAGLPAKCSDSGKNTVRGQARSYRKILRHFV